METAALSEYGLRIRFAAEATIEATRPAWYPFATWTPWTTDVHLEGHVYGGRGAALMRAIEDVRAHDDASLAESMRTCAIAVDGDFVVVRHDPTEGTLAVTGDRFGRLPLYYRVSDRGVVISRSQRFVHAHTHARDVDRMALAQLLLFGYPLERRTLVDGVSRLLPQEVIVASSRGVRVFAPASPPFQRPDVTPPATPIAAARVLRDAFVAACRDRHLEGHTHVLSLSGGIDSRTAAGAMRTAGIPFSCVTMVSTMHGDERAAASTVARKLPADWRAYEFDATTPADADAIVRLKVGLSPVDLGFGLDYMRHVRRDFGEGVAFWTGEGADKLLCEHRAIPRRPSLDALAQFIIDKNALLDVASVVALTGVSHDDIMASIHSALRAYGGVEPDDAYVHFLLSQRVVRWHDEGEDRHRTAVWPVAPFFAANFVELARSMPADWKFGRRLYRAFLRELAPDLAALPLSGGHAAPASRRFAFEYTLRERIRNSEFASALHRRLRATRQRRAAPSRWHAQLAQIVQTGTVPTPIDAAQLARLVSGGAPPSTQAAAQILTVVLALRSLAD